MQLKLPVFVHIDHLLLFKHKPRSPWDVLPALKYIVLVLEFPP